MNFNPFIGRHYHSPNDDGAAEIAPSLTFTIVILCLVSPFWLIYRLVEYVAARVGLLFGRALPSTKSTK